MKKNPFYFLLFYSILMMVVVISCKKESDLPNNPPQAFFMVSPWTGQTTTYFSFDASYCSDEEDDDSLLVVRWDWQDNESWDTDWSVEKHVIRQFEEEGTYTIKMEVKDRQGATNKVTQDIFVDNTGNEWLGHPCPGIETVTYGDQIYNTVKIGDQCWFRENLNYEVENSRCYANSSAMCDSLGRLYDWHAALTVCPDGWHLPGDEEWKILEGYVDDMHDEGDPEWDLTGFRGYNAGDNLKAKTGWYSGNGNNKFNFRGLPGGFMLPVEFYQYRGIIGFYWSSTDINSTEAVYRSFEYDSDKVRRSYMHKDIMISVRCVKSGKRMD